MSHASITKTRPGCGCGGGGASGKGGCSCGGKAELCEGQDMARPRFFAGQLLTEDDLDLLSTYVVEKNRLHNRSFFGQGVVCGLEVTCDPCGGSKVTVQSGYALDCCGNDIVVPCPQTLDINAMVRQLRIEKTGGIDCGDPCADAKAKSSVPPTPTPAPPPAPAPAGSPTAAMSTFAGAAPGKKEPETPPLPAADYCLYVRYGERLTDPVSPYATDDPCGAQVCEPTRVREGFRFELRCRDCDEPAPDNLFSRIRACVGDLQTAERTVRDLRSVSLYNRYLSPSLARVDEKPVVRFEAERLEAVKAAASRVGDLPAPAKWTAEHAFDASEAGQTLASHVAAWQALTTGERDALTHSDPTIKKSVSEAESALKALEKKTPEADVLAKVIESPLDRDLVTATLRRSVLWQDGQAAMGKVSPSEAALAGSGVMFSRSMRLSTPLARIKSNLINRLTARGPLTDCTLLGDVRAIVIPDESMDNDFESANRTSDAARRLQDALGRYLRECICGAINPPCPPCEDPAVLLACLRVEECQVVDICNLERTFVLSSVAMRYWMPFLGMFGDLLERVCCPHDECDERPKRGALMVPVEEPRPTLMRARFEARSATDLVDRYMAPAMMFDPERLAAFLPRKLSFSPENARRMVSSAAGMLDLASLRRGTAVRDILSPAALSRMAGPAAAPAAAPAAPTTVELEASLGAVRTELDELAKKHAATLKKLDDRVKKLET